MKRLGFLLPFLLLPSLAHAQYTHASFFNGGTTLTATCTNTSGTLASSDVFLGTAQGNTTVTLPASSIGCVDYDVIDLRFTAAASQSYTLTVNNGTGTALSCGHGGTNCSASTSTTSSWVGLIPGQTGAASGAAIGIHQIWVYDAVASTPQWELVTQEAYPSFFVNNLGSSTTPACNFNLGYECQWDQAGSNSTLTVSNIPGSTTAPVIVKLIAKTTGQTTITLPSTFYIPTNGTSATFPLWYGSQSINISSNNDVTSANNVFQFSCNGTKCWWLSGGNTVYAGHIYANTLSLNSDNSVSSMARMPLTFGTGNLTLAGLNGNNFAVYKVVKPLTIENIEGVSIVDSSCAAGSVITVYDCGSSAPANAACSGGTAKANVTLSTTVGTAVDGTVSSSTVAAGEYLGAQISTIGTSCTVLNAVVTLMARPQ